MKTHCIIDCACQRCCTVTACYPHCLLLRALPTCRRQPCRPLSEAALAEVHKMDMESLQDQTQKDYRTVIAALQVGAVL
jgi:hypothetical protein